MRGKERIVGCSETRRRSYKVIIEKLAQELNAGRIATKADAKVRLAAMIDETP